jgi:PAS domain-containing protein/DNA-binding transcriptional MerR regulator
MADDQHGRIYLIGDVAALTGVTDHTLRAWEDYDLLAPKRSAGGVRQYTLEHIALVRLILRTQSERGLSRSAIASLLHSGKLRPDAADYAPGDAPIPRRRAAPTGASPAGSASAPEVRAARLTRILHSLSRVSAAVASGRPLQEVLDVLCKETCDAIGVSDTFLWLIEPARATADREPATAERALILAAGAGKDAEGALGARPSAVIPLSMTRMPAVRAIHTHRTEVINLLDAEPETHPEVAALLPAASLLVTPLFSHHGQAIGALGLREAEDTDRFGDDDREYASLFASQAALAIEAARLQAAQRAAHQEAEHERSRWRAAVDDLPELVCICDADGHFTYASPAYQRLLMLPADPALTSEEWPIHYGLFMPDGRHPFPSEEMVFTRVLRDGLPVGNVETLHRAPDGREYLIVWAGAPMHAPDGSMLGVVAVGRDITEQRRLERELADRARELNAVLEAMPDGVVLFDERNQVRLLNGTMRTLFAVKDRHKTHSLTLEKRAAHFDLRDEHGQPLPVDELPSVRLLRGEPLGPDGTTDMRVRLPDGSVSHFSVSGSTLCDETDQIVGALMILRDVTQRRRQTERIACLAAVARAAAGAPDSLEGAARSERLLAALREHGRLPLLTAGIYLVDRASGTLQLMGHLTGPDELLTPQLALSPEQPDWDDLANGARYSFASRRPSDWLGPSIRTAWRAETLRGWATAPLRVGDELLGVLVIALTAPHLWDEEERAWFTACADAMAVGLENDRLFAAERRRQEQLHAVIEGVEDGITLLGADGRALVRNTAAAVLTRRTHFTSAGAESAAAYALRDVASGPRSAPLLFDQTPVARALRGERVRDARLLMRDGHGDDRVIASSCYPVRDHTDAVVGAVSIFRDITAETRRMELLRSVGRRLGASLDPQTEMRALVDVLVESQIVRAAGVYRLLPKEQALTLAVARVGQSEAASIDAGSFPLSHAPLAARALESGEPQVAGCAAPLFATVPRMALLLQVAPDVAAIGMFPLLAKGPHEAAFGVLAVAVADAAELDPRSLVILTEAARHAALLIDRAERHQRLLAEAAMRRAP